MAYFLCVQFLSVYNGSHQFPALQWETRNTKASFKSNKTIRVNCVAAMMLCVGGPMASDRRVVMQHSGNRRAFMHSGKMSSMSPPETDPFLLSL